MYPKYRAVISLCNLLWHTIEFVSVHLTTDLGLCIGYLIMSMFHFLSFGTPYILRKVAPFMHAIFTYFILLDSAQLYRMHLYDVPWQRKHKAHENTTYFVCSRVSKCGILQDIHTQGALGTETSWLQACQVSKLWELVLILCISLYLLHPIRPGCIFFLVLGCITISHPFYSICSKICLSKNPFNVWETKMRRGNCSCLVLPMVRVWKIKYHCD